MTPISRAYAQGDYALGQRLTVAAGVAKGGSAESGGALRVAAGAHKGVVVRPTPNAVVRFWSHVDRSGPNGCWLWTAWTDHGYGASTMDGRVMRAHRVAWELLIGTIPEGLELDHLCRVRQCVNPDHLEPVTTRENVRRSVRTARRARTRCMRGHELTPDNTLIQKRHDDDRTYRRCLRCRRASAHAKAKERLTAPVSKSLVRVVARPCLTSDLATAASHKARLPHGFAG